MSYDVRDDEYPSDDQEIQHIISNYNLTCCRYCKSTNITTHFTGFVSCEWCGKHALFGRRFYYLEISREFLDIIGKRNITKEDVIMSWENIKLKYEDDVARKGTRYYFYDKLIEELKR